MITKLLLPPLLAGGYLSDVNTILSDYGLPALGLTIILGAAIGLVKNWDAINDTNGTGRRKEGIINTVYIIGFVLLIVAVMGGVVTAVGRISLKI